MINNLEVLKTCSICKKDFSLESFALQPKGKLGRQANCKNCQQEYYHKHYIKNKKNILKKNKIWKLNNKEKRKISDRNSAYLRKYGITIKQYDEMFLAQNGRCAICGALNSRQSRHNYFSIDHDHKTGKIRGLLCDQCNNVLGRVNDSIDILQSAIDYLKRSL